MPPGIPHTLATPHRPLPHNTRTHNFKAIYLDDRRLVNETGAGYRRFRAVLATSWQRTFPCSIRVLDANLDSQPRALAFFLPNCVGMGTPRRHNDLVHRPVGPAQTALRNVGATLVVALLPSNAVRKPRDHKGRPYSRHVGDPDSVRRPSMRPPHTCSCSPDQKSGFSATGIL